MTEFSGPTGENYAKYRGKCKQFCEDLIKEDPTLTLVRGWYQCPVWGDQEHWWCKKPDGTVVDPTILQFPQPAIGVYKEFTGMCPCEVCGTETPEEETIFMGRYPCCSDTCAKRLVGL